MSHSITIESWSFKSVQDTTWLPAKVPGCVHTDLLREQRIPHPFYGTNEHDLQWIDKQDWEYKASFVASAELLREQVQELHFLGLDTYASVFLNDENILEADNMFRSWRVDVTGKLSEGVNELRIVFRSPIHEDLPKLKVLGYRLPASNDQSELGGLGEDRVSIFARKAPYHYGWDWGPRFVTSGIWRPVELVGYSGILIRDVYIDQLSVNEQQANLVARVQLDTTASGTISLQLTTEDMSWDVQVDKQAGAHELLVPIVINEPKLWWSRGLGEAHRYTFTAQADAEQAGNKHQSLKSVKTGIRAVKLVHDRDAEGTGATFHFELNGIPVFAKGANHIPNDSFITEVTEERYRAEVLAAAEANMNMLRVWGGGIYEADIFYELCDEYGIMVWQDFMFACSMYPGDEHFLENVKQEAIDNVIRLRNHPSIVLWCGNNEIDSAWSHFDENAGWGWKTEFSTELREKLWRDYERIFHEILPDVVSEYHASIDYWPSSPLVSVSNSKEQHAHPGTNEGDIHYWGVWHNVEPFEHYQIKLGRFMSEYGFQSFPEYRTIRSFAEEEELAIDSKVMKAHQKNGDGNRLIKEYMDIYMKQPVNFKSFLYLSQVLQADAMKMAIEAHRRKMPYCMGSLYWQMNDCWPVASWSGIDYYGRWKALHYYARRSFAPLLLSGQEEHDQLHLYMVSEQLTATSGVLTVELFHLSGKLISSSSKEIASPCNTSQLVQSLPIPALLGDSRKEEVVLIASWLGENNETARYEHYFVKNQQLVLQQPTITVQEEHTQDGTIITLTSDVVAKQVVLIAEHEGVWSDNYFDLIPGKPHTVVFNSYDGGAVYRPSQSGKVEIQSMYEHVIHSTSVATEA